MKMGIYIFTFGKGNKMLNDKISNDLKVAMKSKNALKVSCLRLIIAEAKNTSIAKQKELTDDDIMGIMQRQVKQRKDSIESFKKGNRQDLVEKEQKELEIIQDYLPKQLTPEEIATIVKKAIEEIGPTGKKDMGKVMGIVMGKVKGKTDGKIVTQIVNEELDKNEKQQ